MSAEHSPAAPASVAVAREAASTPDTPSSVGIGDLALEDLDDMEELLADAGHATWRGQAPEGLVRSAAACDCQGRTNAE